MAFFYLMNAIEAAVRDAGHTEEKEIGISTIHIDNHSTSFELGVLHKFARFAFILLLLMLFFFVFLCLFYSSISLALPLSRFLFIVCILNRFDTDAAF